MNSTVQNAISKVAGEFRRISLEEMESVKLMNRVDTKYLIPAWKLPYLLSALQTDHFIQEVAGLVESHYATVYFDTSDNEMYLIHQNGKRTRQKVRVRHYVDSGGYFLEIKKKNNHGRTKKKRCECTASGWEGSPELAAFLKEKSAYCTEDLFQRLETDFHRITLVDYTKTHRLTIDYHLRFHNFETGKEVALDDVIILELKEDGLCHSNVKPRFLALGIHPLSLSKYCIGCALTNPMLKQNRFKPKIRMINKLSNSYDEFSSHNRPIGRIG